MPLKDGGTKDAGLEVCIYLVCPPLMESIFKSAQWNGAWFGVCS